MLVLQSSVGHDRRTPSAEDLPPLAVTRLTMRGTILAPRTRRVARADAARASSAGLSVDGAAGEAWTASNSAAGAHDVVITATLDRPRVDAGAALERGRSVCCAACNGHAAVSDSTAPFRPWAQWIPFSLLGIPRA